MDMPKPTDAHRKLEGLAGAWKGTCEGFTLGESFTIKQTGCVLFEIDSMANLPIMVGADNVLSLTLPSYTAGAPAAVYTVNYATSWNVDQTALMAEYGVRGRNLSINDPKVWVETGKAEYKLDGDKLVVTQNTGKTSKTCNYTKQ